MASTDFMTPRGLLKSDGNYAAQHQAIYDLVKYMEFGESLPETMAEYQERLGLSFAVMIFLQQVLEPVLEAYSRVKADSYVCGDTVYPSILQTAGLTSHYARNAADMTSLIFDLIRDLDNTTDETVARDLTEEVNNLIADQIESIAVLNVHSQVCFELLHELEGRMKASQQLVKQRSDAVHKLIAEDLAEFQAMEKLMHLIRLMVRQHSAQYERDELLTCTAQSYAWLGLSGIIVSSAVASIRGGDATEIADLLDNACQAYFVGSVDKERMSIGADLGAIDTDLDSVLGQIGPAITVVEQMMGSWTAISSDLSNLLDMVKNDIKGANQRETDEKNAFYAEKEKWPKKSNIFHFFGPGDEKLRVYFRASTGSEGEEHPEMGISKAMVGSNFRGHLNTSAGV
ncbi:hypothetical protein EV714DRAFT_239997 [Schizophyllum commune]